MSEIMDLVFKKKRKLAVPQLNFFKNFYEEIKDKAMTDDEIFCSFDHSEMFFKTMRYMIKSRKPWNNAILGDPGSGKSTILALLVQEGNNIMKEMKLLFKKEDGTYDNTRKRKFDNFTQVVADQNEFLTLIKGEIWSCFIGIDEYNRMADTGLNSSIDAILNATYSDIFAQQHVNRIHCSPSVVSDINTWLILEIYGTNEKEKVTTCKLIYRDIVSNSRQVLGQVNFFVGDIMDEKWYKRYRRKKFKRMELLQKCGIRKFSELEIAPIVLDVYEDLSELAFGDRKVDPDVVLSSVKQIMREKVYIGSMLAESEMSSEVRHLLGLKHNIEKDKLRILAEKDKKLPNGLIIKELGKRIRKVQAKLEKSLEYHNKMLRIYKEYMTIK